MECFLADVDAVSQDGSLFHFGMCGKKTTELANRRALGELFSHEIVVVVVFDRFYI